jgi:hypothetical protein
MISRWMQKKDLLEAYSGKNTKRRITTRSALYPKLEDQLYTWIINSRIKKASIYWSDIRNQTKKIIQCVEDTTEYANLKISDCWLKNFGPS